DAFGADEPGVDEDAQMLACGWLADAELLGDKKTTDAVRHEIAFDLWWKVGPRLLQPAHDLETAVIGEGLDDVRRQQRRRARLRRCGCAQRWSSGRPRHHLFVSLTICHVTNSIVNSRVERPGGQEEPGLTIRRADIEDAYQRI